MNYIVPAIVYVVSDMFFWPSMAFTTMIGIFIGSVLYNGDVSQAKKMIVSVTCYGSIITIVNFTRVFKILNTIIPGNQAGHPLAAIMTLIIVTFFYLIGTYLGVRVTKKAHK